MKYLAIAFRECAEAFRQAQKHDNQERAIIKLQAARDAGNAIRVSWKSGVLKIEGLEKLIEYWKEIFPSNYPECDENLFFEVAADKVEYQYGKMGETIPGLIAKLSPEIFRSSLLLSSESRASHGWYEEQQLRRYAIACDLLSDSIAEPAEVYVLGSRFPNFTALSNLNDKTTRSKFLSRHADCIRTVKVPGGKEVYIHWDSFKKTFENEYHPITLPEVPPEVLKPTRLNAG